MKSELDPITDDEWLLRRVHIDNFSSAGVLDNTFKPRISGRDPDRNGISLYRCSCLLNPTDILAAIPEVRKRDSGIIQIPVSLIREMGLSVVSDADECVRGHVVIPELNADYYKANKLRCASLMARLAAIASDPANILLRPSPRVS